LAAKPGRVLIAHADQKKAAKNPLATRATRRRTGCRGAVNVELVIAQVESKLLLCRSVLLLDRGSARKQQLILPRGKVYLRRRTGFCYMSYVTFAILWLWPKIKLSPPPPNASARVPCGFSQQIGDLEDDAGAEALDRIRTGWLTGSPRFLW